MGSHYDRLYASSMRLTRCASSKAVLASVNYPGRPANRIVANHRLQRRPTFDGDIGP